MKTTGIIGGMAIIAATLFAGIAGAVFGLGKIQQALAALDLAPQTCLILGSASLVLLLSALSIGVTIRSAARREIEWRRAESLAPIYEELIDSLAGPLPAIREHTRLQRLLFLKSGAAVLKEYCALRALPAGGDTDSERVQRQISRLLLALRRDLCGTTLGLEQEDWSGWLRHSPLRAMEPDNEVPVPANRNGASSQTAIHRLRSPPEFAGYCSPMPAQDQPSVSCIMPTFNRRAFGRRAIYCYLVQDYVEKELAIVDHGADASADLVPKDEGIRSFRQEARLPIGAKRNMGRQKALSEFVFLWDNHSGRRAALQHSCERCCRSRRHLADEVIDWGYVAFEHQGERVAGG